MGRDYKKEIQSLLSTTESMSQSKIATILRINHYVAQSHLIELEKEKKIKCIKKPNSTHYALR